MLFNVCKSIPIIEFYLECEGWQYRDCGGTDIAGQNFQPLSKCDCAKKCNQLTECTFAVYGGSTSSSSDVDYMRCLLRKDFADTCHTGQTFRETFVKEESTSHEGNIGTKK